MLENLDFGRNFRKIAFRKSRFWSKFSKKSDFGRNFRKKKSVWLEIFVKSQYWWKFSKNPELCKNFRKSRHVSKLSKTSDFVRNYFINFDFRRNVRKSPFWSNCSENLELGKKKKNSRLLTKFSKIATEVYYFEKCRWGENCWKISI